MRKIYIVILSLLIIVLVIAALLLKNRKAKTSEDFPLKIGSGGKNVLQLQLYLNQKGAKLTEDGFLGPETEKAIHQFLNRKTISKEYFEKAIKNHGSAGK